jgi:tetratricopeptide (TPR) repeat protein
MQLDYLGNPVTEQHSSGTLRAIDDFIEGFLAYETRAEGIVAAASEDAQSCIANAYAGFMWMLLEAPEAAQRAGQFLAAAERAAPRATRREQLNVGVLCAWVADDLPLALRLCEQVSDEFPRDLAIAKIHQYFEFNRGNSPAMLRVALKIRAAAADVPYVHGMLAFAYEQCHLLAEAETAARTAMTMRDKEPWAQHALAHVLLTRGRVDEGANFLEAASSTWIGLNSFMLTHIWWHLALFYLSQGRDEAVLEVYDRRCWGVAKAYSQDQINAVSLLARCEIAGVDVGDRWQDVADHLEPRARDTVQPFLTMQYLYGLARARRPQAVSLLDAVREQAQSAPPDRRMVWHEVALPACEGLYAYAMGEHDAAWRKLEAVIPRMTEIGGSHAQRDLFEQILLDAALKSGRLVSAQQMLELRRHADPDGVPVNMALADIYGRLGLPQLAEQARTRAVNTRARYGSRASYGS